MTKTVVVIRIHNRGGNKGIKPWWSYVYIAIAVIRLIVVVVIYSYGRGGIRSYDHDSQMGICP